MVTMQRLTAPTSAGTRSRQVPFTSRPNIRAHRKLQCVIVASSENANNVSSDGKRALLGLTAGLASAALLFSNPQVAFAGEPFLTATGARGPFVEQEHALYNMRVEKEGAMRREIQQQRQLLESEAQAGQSNQLCVTPFGFDVVGLTITIALIGAAVGGYTAKQRKEEAEKLNEQLRKINASLRQQARGTMYAPGLQYAPPNGNGSSSSSSNVATITLPKPAIVTPSPAAAAAAAAAASAAAAAAAPVVAQTLLSMDEDEMTAEQLECKQTLRSGKRLLKENDAAGAQTNFAQALVLSRMIGDRVQERRATRGLAASARLQGQFKTAIEYLGRVLEISREMKDYTGDADAYGTIADCYTELGNMEKAAEFYDMYIKHMED